MTICGKSTHPQAIQDVDVFFVFFQNRFGEMQHYITCSNGSSAVNRCRQNESTNMLNDGFVSYKHRFSLPDID